MNYRKQNVILSSKKDTKNSKFKHDSYIVYILEFPGDIIVKISANLSGSFNHFHELKIFSNALSHSPAVN